MKTPTAYERYAAQVRAQGRSCTPHRLGIAVGAAGDNLPSPYATDSRGDHGYRAGLEFGRAERKINAMACELYVAATANDQTIHCNRLPAWSELTGPQRWQWREKALEALEGLIEWDKTRNFPVPYKVRDPIHAAIKAIRAVGVREDANGC